MHAIAISGNQDTQVSMTSLEIAELTGKQHDNVRRDILKMADELSLTFEEKVVASKGGRPLKVFYLGKRETLILVSGYDTVLRAKVVDRVAELERKPMLALTRTAEACGIIEDTMKVAALFGVPAHYAQTEAVKMAKTATGVDYAPLLTYSPAQDAVAANDVMLEPTELGKRFSLSAVETNKLLAGAGMQNRVNGDWAPTALASGKCAVHHWSNLGKSGYNLKWKVSAVAHLFGKAA